VWEEKGAATIVEQRQLLGSLLKGGAVCYAFPSVANYPAIEGGHSALEMVGAGGKKTPIAALVQMKLSKLAKSDLERFLAAMHAEAKLLGLKKEEYVAILYTASLPQSAILPRGSLVICHEAIEALAAPLGRESVMAMMMSDCDPLAAQEVVEANPSRDTKPKETARKPKKAPKKRTTRKT
jgi:hypothetical protein